MQARIAVFSMLSLVAIAVSGCGPSPGEEPKPGTPAAGALTAVKVEQAPVLDGEVEGLWEQAAAIKVRVMGGANLPGGRTEVSLKALYSETHLHLLVQWEDPTQSHRRSPWQKQADGTWLKLIDPADRGGDNNTYYEDKLSFLWDINMAGFSEAGCALSCHAGEAGKPYGNKYTADAGELGDLWHWKSVRTGPVGQIDDQYLDSTRHDKETSPRAGRNNDPSTGGGYVNNVAEDGSGPKFAAKGNQPAPPYWILDAEKEPVDAGRYQAGDEVAGVTIAPIEGDRGDVAAGAKWSDGLWTLELSRKLVTGSTFDVQFDDLTKQYHFGVAIFDNAQVRHAVAAAPSRLAFQE